MTSSPRNPHRLSASLLALWLLLSPTGLVGAAILPSAGNTLAVANARETDSGTYSAHSNTVSDERQWQKDSGQASRISAGKNLALVATHNSETRQESYSNQGKRGGQQASLALQNDTASGSIDNRPVTLKDGAEYAGARTILVNLEEPLHPNPAFQEIYLGPAELLLAELLAL